MIIVSAIETVHVKLSNDRFHRDQPAFEMCRWLERFTKTSDDKCV